MTEEEVENKGERLGGRLGMSLLLARVAEDQDDQKLERDDREFDEDNSYMASALITSSRIFLKRMHEFIFY